MVISPQGIGNIVSNIGDASGNDSLSTKGDEISSDLFGVKADGEQTAAEQAANATQIADERAYSEQQINSARAWEEYMSSTQYQRAVKDLKAAGLNPWLAVQSGLSGGSYHSTDSGNTAGSSARSSSVSKSQSTSSSFSNSAIIAALIMLAAKVLI